MTTTMNAVNPRLQQTALRVFAPLPRQCREVAVELALTDKTMCDIAKERFRAFRTVEGHAKKACKLMDVHGRHGLALLVMRAFAEENP